MIEGLRLGIAEEAVLQTENHVLVSTDIDDLDSIASFTRGVNRRMRTEQPELFKYLRFSAQNTRSRTGALTFGYAAALSFDMIPDQVRLEPLTEEQIDVVRGSVAESTDVEEQGSKMMVFQLSWFVDKLKTDSPAYMEWLGEMVGDLNDEADKNDFILGSLLTVMPFYTRADSRILAKRLLGQDKLGH